MVGVMIHMGESPEGISGPEALCERASCGGGMGTKKATERAPEQSATDKLCRCKRE